MEQDFKSKYRKHGEEQPYIPFAGLKIRLPFIHYRFEVPEFAQGFILVAVALSATAPIMEGLHLTDLLGGNAALAFQVAVVIVMINALGTLLHPSLGDPVIPGWITPAIPLTLAYLASFGDDPVSRLHAMRALQFTMCIVFILLGATGMAKKIISIVPMSIRSGVLMGAAILAVQGVIMPGGRMSGTEISTIIGLVITFLMLYSIHYRNASNKSNILRLIGKYGMLPGMVIALIVGMIIGELPIPTIEWGLTPMPFMETFRAFSVFTHGLPPVGYFVSSIPLVVTAYIIAFGDIVTAEAIANEAGTVRKDEKIVFNSNKSHIILGIRNFIQSIITPFVPLSGPLWTGGMIAVAERYKTGHKNMDSIYCGVFWYPFGKVVALCFAFIVTGLGPALPVAMSITMIVTGWAAGYVAIQMVKNREAQGIAILTGCAIAFQGPAVGLAVGVICHLIIGAVKPPPEEKLSVSETPQRREKA
ncbi:MAG: hypothetical protein FWB91_01400 [Defluviitaleaceae bacterium]|nr:hypothetical protein [Defluviitaleaceae bacterium]